MCLVNQQPTQEKPTSWCSKCHYYSHLRDEKTEAQAPGRILSSGQTGGSDFKPPHHIDGCSYTVHTSLIEGRGCKRGRRTYFVFSMRKAAETI